MVQNNKFSLGLWRLRNGTFALVERWDVEHLVWVGFLLQEDGHKSAVLCWDDKGNSKLETNFDLMTSKRGTDQFVEGTDVMWPTVRV